MHLTELNRNRAVKKPHMVGLGGNKHFHKMFFSISFFQYASSTKYVSSLWADSNQDEDRLQKVHDVYSDVCGCNLATDKNEQGQVKIKSEAKVPQNKVLCPWLQMKPLKRRVKWTHCEMDPMYWHCIYWQLVTSQAHLVMNGAISTPHLHSAMSKRNP